MQRRPLNHERWRLRIAIGSQTTLHYPHNVSQPQRYMQSDVARLPLSLRATHYSVVLSECQDNVTTLAESSLLLIECTTRPLLTLWF